MPSSTNAMSYAPCSHCGAEWNATSQRYYHKKTCTFQREATKIEQATRPLPEALHILIDRHANAYARYAAIHARVDSDPRSRELSTESLTRARAALNAAISAHRLG